VVVARPDRSMVVRRRDYGRAAKVFGRQAMFIDERKICSLAQSSFIAFENALLLSGSQVLVGSSASYLTCSSVQLFKFPSLPRHLHSVSVLENLECSICCECDCFVSRVGLLAMCVMHG
jgi:hypothetical protein